MKALVAVAAAAVVFAAGVVTATTLMRANQPPAAPTTVVAVESDVAQPLSTPAPAEPVRSAPAAASETPTPRPSASRTPTPAPSEPIDCSTTGPDMEDIPPECNDEYDPALSEYVPTQDVIAVHVLSRKYGVPQQGCSYAFIDNVPPNLRVFNEHGDVLASTRLPYGSIETGMGGRARCRQTAVIDYIAAQHYQFGVFQVPPVVISSRELESANRTVTIVADR